MNKGKLSIDINRLFWFLRRDKDVLDISKDRHFIIHQSFALGSMDDVKNIFNQYDKAVIRQEFKNPVRGLYSPVILNFFEHILNVKLKNREIYIKNIYEKTSSRNS